MSKKLKRGLDIEVFPDAFAGYWVVTKRQFWLGDFNKSKEAAWAFAKLLADKTNAIARLVEARHGEPADTYKPEAHSDD